MHLLQAAIDRAEEKRRSLQSRDDRTLGPKLAIALPRAAELYRRQISLGLEGDPRATIKARMLLRELFGGRVRLVPQLDGGLIAHWNLHPGVLLKTLGTSGSGGERPDSATLLRFPLAAPPELAKYSPHRAKRATAA